MRNLIGLLVGLFVLLVVARPAKADEVPIRVVFDVKYEERPETLCIVSRLQDSQSVTLSTLGKSNDRDARWSWTFESRVVTNPMMQSVLNDLVDRSARAAREPPGGGSPDEQCQRGECRPDIEKPGEDNLSVSCRKNSQDKGVHGTVFLYLNFHREASEKPPALSSPYLSGTAASLKMNLASPRTFVSAQVIGGDYLPGAVVVLSHDRNGEETGTIRLDPRCRQHELSIPATSEVGSVDARVLVGRLESARPTKINISANRFSMCLPYGWDGKSKTVSVSVGVGTLDFARFSSTWTTRAPPNNIELHSDIISFSWRVDPLYGNAMCPAARLAGATRDCGRDEDRRQDSDERICRYICGASEGVVSRRIVLPVEVVFTAQSEPSQVSGLGKTHFCSTVGKGKKAVPAVAMESWRALVPQAFGSEIDAYVAPSDRSIVVDFINAPVMTPGSRVDEVQLRTVEGAVRRVFVKRPTTVATEDNGEAIDSCLRVDLANIDAGDVLAFRYVGDRSFREDALRIDGRVLELPNPASSARTLALSPYLGVGYGDSISMRQPRAGTSDFAGAIQGELDVALQYRPWAWRFGFEGHFGGIMTERSYEGAARDGIATGGGGAPYLRLGPAGGVHFVISHASAVGVLFGGVRSFAPFGDDAQVVGKAQTNPTMLWFARLRPTDFVSVELGVRVIFNDGFPVFVTAGREGTAPPTVAEGMATTVTGSIGLRFDIPFAVKLNDIFKNVEVSEPTRRAPGVPRGSPVRPRKGPPREEKGLAAQTQ